MVKKLILIAAFLSAFLVCSSTFAKPAADVFAQPEAKLNLDDQLTRTKLAFKLGKYVLPECEAQKGTRIMVGDDAMMDAGEACYYSQTRLPENLGVCLRRMSDNEDHGGYDNCLRAIFDATNRFVCSDLHDPDEFAYCFSLLFPAAYAKGVIPASEIARLKTEKAIDLTAGETTNHEKYAAAGFNTDGPELDFAPGNLYLRRWSGQVENVQCFDKDYDYLKTRFANFYLTYSGSPYRHIKDQFVFIRKCEFTDNSPRKFSARIYFDVFNPYP